MTAVPPALLGVRWRRAAPGGFAPDCATAGVAPGGSATPGCGGWLVSAPGTPPALPAPLRGFFDVDSLRTTWLCGLNCSRVDSVVAMSTCATTCARTRPGPTSGVSISWMRCE